MRAPPAHRLALGGAMGVRRGKLKRCAVPKKVLACVLRAQQYARLKRSLMHASRDAHTPAEQWGRSIWLRPEHSLLAAAFISLPLSLPHCSRTYTVWTTAIWMKRRRGCAQVCGQQHAAQHRELRHPGRQAERGERRVLHHHAHHPQAAGHLRHRRGALRSPQVAARARHSSFLVGLHVRRNRRLSPHSRAPLSLLV